MCRKNDKGEFVEECWQMPELTDEQHLALEDHIRRLLEQTEDTPSE